MRLNAQQENEPEDFKSLLARTEKHAASSTDTHTLNLDHLTREKVNAGSTAPSSPKKQSMASSPLSVLLHHFGDRLSAYISMLCYFYPCMCGTIVFMVIGCILYGLGSLIFNPTVEYGVMKHDHSFLESKYNLKVGDIDHWCLRGDNDSCRCEDPLVPTSRADRKSWRLAFKTNRKMVKALQDATDLDLDIVFVGESVVEEMDGRWMGQGGRSPALKRLSEQFHSRFSRAKGGKFNAAALGIAGDTAPNVLWRLLHGEMTPELNPKIWWLSLGMNDLSRMQCSEEVVVMGILRVVEELLEAKPTAQIVINSLFPMSMVRGGLYPQRNDFQDSFRRPQGTGLRARAHASARTADPRLQVPKNSIAGSAGGTPPHRFLARTHKAKYATKPVTQMTEEEAAEAEDRAREKRNQHHKPFAYPATWKKKRIENKVNPVLKETHKIHKHVSDMQLPIWTSVQVINRQLRKFAQQHDRVTFFDTTKLFTTRVGGGMQQMLQTDMISIRGHPTAQGFSAWEDAIVEKASTIMDDLRKNNPELFPVKDTGGSAPAPTGGNTTDGTTPEGGTPPDTGASMLDILDFDSFPADDDFTDDAFFNHADDDFPIMPNAGGSTPENGAPPADIAAGAGN
uniref:SGNH hydrolase-type esterase domain-containing protein n=1 Tax=Entomoneis paludosa TaxID=265537 RepID=A0A6U2ZR75_9STRA|mmetsp:Transcript_20927/g.43753  ORF Transcript_20927/g.43753 Transcript_20927/m.43753 type:complete len:624 (+) Transcript_20927:289-2160(+)